MADFWRDGPSACETRVFTPAGTFWAAYTHNRDDAFQTVIGADPVAAAVAQLHGKRERSGRETASDLLSALANQEGEASCEIEGAGRVVRRPYLAA